MRPRTSCIGVVGEQNRFVGGEELGEVFVRHGLVVVLRGLQLQEVNNVDDLELDAFLVQGIGSSHDLPKSGHACGGEDNLDLVVALGVGSPLPLGGAGLELGTSLVEGNPGRSRLLAGEDRVDLVGGLEALLGDREQHVGVGREVDVRHVVVVERLVDQDGGDTRVLMREAVVVLTPHAVRRRGG